MHHPVQVSKEVTQGSDKEAPSDDTTRRAQDNVRSGNKRCPLGTVTMASRNVDCSWEACSSGMGCISATTHSGRCLTRTPIDYFKRLLEEACPNNAYPVRHKLKDCGMMQCFMTSESLT
jgi:hypothetical protein